MSGQKDGKRFISPSGAFIAIVCFFLPWAKFSCMGTEKTVSGADIGGVVWLVMLLALVIVSVFFAFMNDNKPEKATPFIIISALAAICLMFFRYLYFMKNGIKTDMGTMFPGKDFEFSVQFGSIGTIAGFIMAMIGTTFLKDDSPPVRHQSQSPYQPVGALSPDGAKEFELIRRETMRGKKIFCAGCRGVDTDSDMYYRARLDLYYHERCLPPAFRPSTPASSPPVQSPAPAQAAAPAQSAAPVHAPAPAPEQAPAIAGRDPDAYFCTNCGQRLRPEGMFCTKCGLEIA